MIVYIVLSHDSGPYMLSDGWEGLKKLKMKNILCFGYGPYVSFRTRKAAQNALDRTKRYADNHDGGKYKNWRTWLDRSYVVRVEVDASV